MVYEMEELLDYTLYDTMAYGNVWHLAKKFYEYKATVLSFWIPLFAGVMVPVAIFAHLYGVFFHNSRERMSRKMELMHGAGRMGLCYPVFLGLYIACVGFQGESSQSASVYSDDASEEVIVKAKYGIAMLVKCCHGGIYFAILLVCAQLLQRFIYVLGRTERPVPSIAEIRARMRHEPTWSLRSRTAERRGRARRRGFTAIPLCISLICLGYGLWMPTLVSEMTYDQDIAMITEFQSVAIDENFVFVLDASYEIGAFDMPTYLAEGYGMSQKTGYTEILGNLVFYGLVIGAPLCRALLCLIMWLVPFTTTTHHIYLHFIELLSVICAADIFAIMSGFACLELDGFFLDSLDAGTSDTVDSYSISPEAAYAALLVGSLLEGATSSWIRWRLQCELEDGTGPARLRTFRDWLLSADDADPPLNKEQEANGLLPEESKEYGAGAPDALYAASDTSI